MICGTPHLRKIPVGWDKILSRISGIPAVLQILHKLYLATTSKEFHPGKAGSRICTARTKFYHVMTSARPSGIKKSINTSV